MLEGYGGMTTFPPTDAFFQTLDPMEQFGLTGSVPVQNDAVTAIPGIARSTGPGGHMTTAPLWSPENPMFIVGALLAITTGLVAFSTSFGVRAGKQRARLGLDIGKA